MKDFKMAPTKLESVIDNLDNDESAAILSREENLASLGQFDVFADFYLAFGLLGNVPHIGQTPVDQNPLAIMEMEVAYRFLVLGLYTLVRCY